MAAAGQAFGLARAAPGSTGRNVNIMIRDISDTATVYAISATSYTVGWDVEQKCQVVHLITLIYCSNF